MSGGSFNYLYNRPDEEHLGTSSEYQRMAASLASRGHYDAAAFALLIATHLDDALRLAELLRPVFHAEEWCVSGDVGPDEVIQAVREMRATMMRGGRRR